MPASSHRIATLADVRAIRRQILRAATRSKTELARAAAQLSPFALLAALKLENTGFHPLSAARLNFIEQLNQSLTCLASLAAVSHLLAAHPSGSPYQLNLGSAAGTDILGADGLVAAEVFSTVHPRNNGKLTSDVRKVSLVHAEHRYVFFYSPAVPPGAQASLADYPAVQIIALSRKSVLGSSAGA
jgi:hypothetical protein